MMLVKYFQAYLEEFRHIQSVRDILDIFVDDGIELATIMDVIYDVICPIPGDGFPYIFDQVEIPTNISFDDSNPICEDGVGVGVVRWGLIIFNEYYYARSHRVFCR